VQLLLFGTSLPGWERVTLRSTERAARALARATLVIVCLPAQRYVEVLAAARAQNPPVQCIVLARDVQATRSALAQEGIPAEVLYRPESLDPVLARLGVTPEMEGLR